MHSGKGPKCWDNINDEKEGDEHAWSAGEGGKVENNYFVGVRFPQPTRIVGLRLSRGEDHHNHFNDSYLIEYSNAAGTSYGDFGSGWCKAGTYVPDGPGYQYLSLQSEDVVTWAVRVRVTSPYTVIDELQVFGKAEVPQQPPALLAPDGAENSIEVITEDKDGDIASNKTKLKEIACAVARANGLDCKDVDAAVVNTIPVQGGSTVGGLLQGHAHVGASKRSSASGLLEAAPAHAEDRSRRQRTASTRSHKTQPEVADVRVTTKDGKPLSAGSATVRKEVAETDSSIEVVGTTHNHSVAVQMEEKVIEKGKEERISELADSQTKSQAVARQPAITLILAVLAFCMP